VSSARSIRETFSWVIPEALGQLDLREAALTTKFNGANCGEDLSRALLNLGTTFRIRLERSDEVIELFGLRAHPRRSAVSVARTRSSGWASLIP
jgi:hypothetical protein